MLGLGLGRPCDASLRKLGCVLRKISIQNDKDYQQHQAQPACQDQEDAHVTPQLTPCRHFFFNLQSAENGRGPRVELLINTLPSANGDDNGDNYDDDGDNYYDGDICIMMHAVFVCNEK